MTPAFSHLARMALLVVLMLAPDLSRLHAQGLPLPTGKVNDFANVLDASQRATLESQLAELERETSAEVALVTLATLDRRGVEDYAVDLFNTWGIGKKERDNGVLVLVAVQDRAMRIEVGYGLEGILPDGLAGEIVREQFLPRFRSGDYRTGIVDGMARLVEIVRRHETLTGEERLALAQRASDAGKSWGMAAFFALFVAAGAFALGTALGARLAVQLGFGLLFTVGAVFMSTLAAPRAAVAVLAVFAIAVTASGFFLAKRPAWRRRLRGTGKGAGGRGWITESAGSSSSSSDSSSSGSSSFGGGSSGGGGASGHW